MWWDMTPEARAEFEHWHSHEHFPERLRIPGFHRGTRWRSATGGPGFFVMYELEAYQTLSSAHYLARLNSPSPWSTRMMPHHRNMVRSQCCVLETGGAGVAHYALTVRLSPAAGCGEQLRGHLSALIGNVVTRPGLVGMHLLKHETPAIAPTTEQLIRGDADQAADWVVVVCGYDLAVLQQLAATALGADLLAQQGAAAGQVSALYELSYSATPGDVA